MLEFVVSGLIVIGVMYFINYLKDSREYTEHLFEGYPDGTFYVREKYRGVLLLLMILQIIPFWWVYVNLPELAQVASVYLFFLTPLVGVFYLEMMFPAKTRYTAIVGLGEGDYEYQVLAGIVIGVAVIMSYKLFPQVQFAYVSVPAFVTYVSFYFTVIAVPFTEEAVFGNFITTSILEEIGVLPALLVSGVVFALFHFAVYQANIYYMFMAFAFRVMAGFALIKYRSFLPGLVGHIIINFVSTVG